MRSISARGFSFTGPTIRSRSAGARHTAASVCRMKMLKSVYKAAEIGTEVYIFDSRARETAEIHSDLDYLKD